MILYICFLNNILIYDATFEGHVKHLKEVLQRLITAGLKIKPSKTFVGMSKINFSGHEILSEGPRPGQRMIDKPCLTDN